MSSEDKKSKHTGRLILPGYVVEKPHMALNAMSELTRAFANKPDFAKLIRSLVLSLSGQFAVTNAFAILRKPGAQNRQTVYIPTGKFKDNLILQTLILTPGLTRFFRSIDSRSAIVEGMIGDPDAERNGVILNEAGVIRVAPILHNDSLLGLIGMGEKVTKQPFVDEEVDLFDTLISTITPIIASSYQFWEIAQLSSWYLDILDSVKQGVFTFGSDHRLKKINRAGVEILHTFDSSASDAISLVQPPIEEVFDEVIYPDWARIFIKTIAEKRKGNLGYMTAGVDDGQRVYSVFLNTIAGESEYEEDLIVTLDDVTEQKVAEKELLFTQFAVDNSADSAFWIDIDGKLVYVNDVACRRLGYTRREMLEMTVHDIVPNLSVDAWPQHWKDVKTRGHITIASNHKAKNRTLLPVEVNINYMEFEGQQFNCAFARDVSDRLQLQEQEKRLQEKLDRAERMESLGILAGGVAHDLNNMLGPLVGYPELLLRKMPDDSPYRKQVQRIGNAAQDAADVVQDLLTLARRGRYEMGPVCINDIIESFLDSPGFAGAKEKHTEVMVEVELDSSICNINGSTPHLYKTVMNLIINAMDAMPNGGQLTITTTQKELKRLIGGHETIEPGEYLIFSVRDTGTGIDPMDLARIFEPYYSKKKMGASGSGLGLSVVYGVVKDHHGYYDVISELGKGTDFVLYFPITTDKIDDTEAESTELGGTESILVVDDVPDQREMASDLLSSLGYEVHTVEHGHAALGFLEKQSVDLILLDMIMEKDFDGLDTFQAITKICTEPNVIIVSGFSATDRVDQMQKLGAGPYIKKPYTLKTIDKAIRTMVDRKPALVTE